MMFLLIIYTEILGSIYGLAHRDIEMERGKEDLSASRGEVVVADHMGWLTSRVGGWVWELWWLLGFCFYVFN